MQNAKQKTIKIEDLIELGLSINEANKYIEYNNNPTYIEKKIKLLKDFRCKLLHAIHEEHKKIDKVDYLIYKIKKEKNI